MRVRVPRRAAQLGAVARLRRLAAEKDERAREAAAAGGAPDIDDGGDDSGSGGEYDDSPGDYDEDADGSGGEGGEAEGGAAPTEGGAAPADGGAAPTDNGAAPADGGRRLLDNSPEGEGKGASAEEARVGGASTHAVDSVAHVEV